MSRWNYSGKTEADDLRKIDVRFLAKHGYFKGYISGTMTWTRNGVWGESKNSVGIQASTLDGNNYLRIYYTQTKTDTGEKKEYDYNIQLTTTPCNYGGKRYWFLCAASKNGVHCGRRVGTLYLGDAIFACRHCYDLTYESRKENRRHRLFSLFNTITIHDKADKLEAQMKRRYYRGKPTKKHQRLMQLHRRAGISYLHHAQLERQKLV